MQDFSENRKHGVSYSNQSAYGVGVDQEGKNLLSGEMDGRFEIKEIECYQLVLE